MLKPSLGVKRLLADHVTQTSRPLNSGGVESSFSSFISSSHSSSNVFLNHRLVVTLLMVRLHSEMFAIKHIVRVPNLEVASDLASDLIAFSSIIHHLASLMESGVSAYRPTTVRQDGTQPSRRSVVKSMFESSYLCW